MFGKSKKRAAGVLAVSMVIAGTALAGSAQAAAPPVPGCSSSAVRVDLKGLLGSVSLNPFQVGAGRTCSTQFQREVGLSAGAISAQSVVDDTDVSGIAHALIAHANVTIPGLTVDATALETAALAICGDHSGFFTPSQVGQLTVNGHPIVIPAHNAPAVIVLPLGIVVYLNRVQTTPLGTTVDAISITTPLANVNIAESKLTGSPCSFGDEEPLS